MRFLFLVRDKDDPFTNLQEIDAQAKGKHSDSNDFGALSKKAMQKSRMRTGSINYQDFEEEKDREMP